MEKTNLNELKELENEPENKPDETSENEPAQPENEPDTSKNEPETSEKQPDTISQLEKDIATAKKKLAGLQATASKAENYIELVEQSLTVAKQITSLEASLNVARYDLDRPMLIDGINELLAKASMNYTKLAFEVDTDEADNTVYVLKLNDEITAIKRTASTKPSQNWTNGKDTKPVKDVAMLASKETLASVAGYVKASAWSKVIESAKKKGELSDWQPVA